MLTILMPMAGLGSRFAAAGERTPKPLIPVLGQAMFTLALNSIRLMQPDAPVVAVVLRDHQERFGIADGIAAAGPNIRVTVVPELTGGALQTCLAAEALVDPDHPLVVLDCDLTFAAPAWLATLAGDETGTDGADGVLLSFRSRAPRYSYAEVQDGRVTRTAEKDPISDHALIGAYGFGSARRFFSIAADIVQRNERSGNGEFYVSSAYNQLIRQGGIVRLLDADAYWSMGTPEELAACLADAAFVAHAARLRACSPSDQTADS